MCMVRSAPGLGWVSDNWLFYGTGGFGWAYDKFTRTQLSAPLNPAIPPFVDTNALQAGTVVTNSHVRPGWVAGAGVEWALARTWTVKLEYLHFDTASETITGGHFNNLGPSRAPNQASSSVKFLARRSHHRHGARRFQSHLQLTTSS